MELIEILRTIEIAAPPEEVFAILVDPLRRLQLSPQWGKARPENYSADFPLEGSCFWMRPKDEEEPPYQVCVTGYEVNRLFAYQQEDPSQLKAVWELWPESGRTQVAYREEFLPLEPDEPEPETDDEPGDGLEDPLAAIARDPETPLEQAEQDAQLWLDSLKRYAELRGGGWRSLARKAFDGFILPMRADQRRVILILLAFQMVTCVTFLAAAAGLGLARLLFLH